MSLFNIIESTILAGIIILVLATVMAYSTLLERKIVGRMQVRYGPNRVGPFGLLQPLADLIKLLLKEDIVPTQADKPIFQLAPMISLVISMVAFAVIPFGPTFSLFGQQISLRIADVNVGLLYIFGVTSLGVYGIVLAGWSSNNKYSLLGGIRSSAQIISYELAMGMAIMGVLILTGSLSMVDIVSHQANSSPFGWNVFRQPLGFVLYVIAAIAETNRAPFDLPEAEQELVAGYHIEYSSMRFAMFFMAEYINMVTVSAIAVTLYLGGWLGPVFSGVWWFIAKVGLMMFLFVWLRASLPRLRYDRLMTFGWKVLLPLALVNILVTSVMVVAAP